MPNPEKKRLRASLPSFRRLRRRSPRHPRQQRDTNDRHQLMAWALGCTVLSLGLGYASASRPPTPASTVHTNLFAGLAAASICVVARQVYKLWFGRPAPAHPEEAGDGAGPTGA